MQFIGGRVIIETPEMRFIGHAIIISIISMKNNRPWSSSPKLESAEAKLSIKTPAVPHHLN